MLQRIYTERTGAMRERAITIVGSYYDAFTVIDAEGRWEGAAEESMIIEILTDGSDKARDKVCMIARAIKEVNAQDAVLVTRTVQDGELV